MTVVAERTIMVPAFPKLPTKRSAKISKNAEANRKAEAAMTFCQRETGLTREELTEQQRQLRRDMYTRLGKQPPS